MSSIAISMGSWRDWAALLRINRPVGYWLLMWPTMWGLLAASNGFPSLKNLIVFVVGVFLMRSTGCVINDFADRDFDGHVERTQNRPLASGRISASAALAAFCCMMLLALGLVSLTSMLVIKLAFIGAALAAIYPFLKRYTHFPQAWLGMAFGWGVVMAWAAEAGSVTDSPIPWLLFAANIFWSLSYDTAYAIGDRADDMHIGVKSTALWFGDRAITAIIALAVCMLLLLAAAAWLYGGYAWLGWLLAAAWQMYLCVQLYHQGESWSFRFFLLSHWSGALMCAGFLV